jgi:hypothetical protein
MPLGGRLPDRCARCNRPVTLPQVRRTVYWPNSWLYLLSLLSLLIYVIVALIVRKKAVVQVSLCEEHRKQRWPAILMSWLMVLAGIGLGLPRFWPRYGFFIALGARHLPLSATTQHSTTIS